MYSILYIASAETHLWWKLWIPSTQHPPCHAKAQALYFSLLASQVREVSHEIELWQGIHWWNWIKPHPSPGGESPEEKQTYEKTSPKDQCRTKLSTDRFPRFSSPQSKQDRAQVTTGLRLVLLLTLWLQLRSCSQLHLHHWSHTISCSVIVMKMCPQNCTHTTKNHK